MWRARQTVRIFVLQAAPENVRSRGASEHNARDQFPPPPTRVLMLRAHPVRRYFALTLPEITPRDYPRLPESRRTWIGTTTRARCGSPSAACAIRLRTRSRRRSCSLRSMGRRVAARCPCGASCSRCGRQSQTIRRRGSRWAGGGGGGGGVCAWHALSPLAVTPIGGAGTAGAAAALGRWLNSTRSTQCDPLQILCHLSNELETQAAHRR